MEARVNRISLFIFHDIVRHHRDIFFHSVKKHIFKRHLRALHPEKRDRDTVPTFTYPTCTDR